MPRPIFIIGSPRSGTSVLTWALGQHPNISLQPETNWMPKIAETALVAYQIGASRGNFSQLSNAKMPLEAFLAHFGTAIDAISRECFERRVELLSPGFRRRADLPPGKRDPDNRARLIRSPAEPKERWVDGTPEYAFSTYALSLLFPEGRFIHILRRPDQVVNSLSHFKNAGSDGRNFDISAAIDVWMRHTLAAREAAYLLGASKLLRVDNADLASDGPSVLSRCFAFLGEPNCEAAASVLDSKMNSSKAVNKQDSTQQQLQGRSDFKRAQLLYDELRDCRIPQEPDSDAMAKQREQFTEPGGGVVSAIKAALRAIP